MKDNLRLGAVTTAPVASVEGIDSLEMLDGSVARASRKVLQLEAMIGSIDDTLALYNSVQDKSVLKPYFASQVGCSVESLDAAAMIAQLTSAKEKYEVELVASYEGLFKNIFKSIKWTFTKDLKCKEVIGDATKKLASMSKEEVTAFLNSKVDYSAVDYAGAEKLMKFVNLALDFINKWFDKIKDMNKIFFARKMNRHEVAETLAKINADHKRLVQQWGALSSDATEALESFTAKKTTYAARGYSVDRIRGLFAKYNTNVAGNIVKFKQMITLIDHHCSETKVDSIGTDINGNIVVTFKTVVKKQYAALATGAETLNEGYRKLDYMLWRIAKDIL